MKDIKKNNLVEDVFDLDWEEELWCAHCKDDLKPHEGIEVNKKLYCEYCYKNYCFECPECGEEFCMDDIYCYPGATEDNEEDVYYCYNCWEKIFFECPSCEDIFYKEDGFEGEDGELYCQNCVEQ